MIEGAKGSSAPRDERQPSDGATELGAGTGGGTGSGSTTAAGRGPESDAAEDSNRSGSPKPRGLFSDVDQAKPDAAADLAQAPSTEAPESGGESAGKSEPQDDSDGRDADARGAAGGVDSDEPTRDPDIEGGAGAEPNAAAPVVPERATIELPEIEIHELEADPDAVARAAELSTPFIHPVQGVWEQIDGATDADFGPGDYSRSVLMLNPGRGMGAVYRVFRGDITIVLGGEFAIDAPEPTSRLSGTIEIRRDPSLASRFRETPMPIGGTPAVIVTPPAGRGPWSLDWKREGDQLVLGDKRFAPSDRAAFELLRRGGGDVATEADRRERAPNVAVSVRKPSRTGFFGIRGGGKRVCYIVDISGSMMGQKLVRLKQELESSINGLPDETQFSIVFFDGAHHVIQEAWMKGDADKKRAVAAVQAQGTGGGTDPRSAFDFALGGLDPLPDVIFFMTDGMIPPDTASHISGLNGGAARTVVHAICLGENASEPMMRQIANESGGQYLFVPN